MNKKIIGLVIFGLVILGIFLFADFLNTDNKVDAVLAETVEAEIISHALAPSLIFPLRNAVISDEFETFPVVLQPVKQETKVIVTNNGIQMQTLLAEGINQIDVAVSEGINKISIVYEYEADEFTVLASPIVNMLPMVEVRAMLSALPVELEGLPLLDLGFFYDFSWPDFFHFDEEPPYIFLTPEFLACATDVDVHRPLSQDDRQALVDEAQDYSHGAYTLRNDDGDWQIGGAANIQSDTLPVSVLLTDIQKNNNANENDLVKVDVHNPAGHPNVYLFAFPVEVEADRDLTTAVLAANGAQATNTQLAYWQDDQKTAAAKQLPLLIPRDTTSFWVEGLLGGRYRLVTGVPPVGTNANAVRYDRRTNFTRPALGCMRQATLTVPVIDIYQDGAQSPNRLTAFDVLWGARPYFKAKLWPPNGTYEWGARYKLRTTLHDIPGTATDGVHASMDRDTVEQEPRNGASDSGHNVTARGTAGNGNKAQIDGGFQVHDDTNDATPGDNIPQANGGAANRYPDRISLGYTVEGETLVRPEHLQVIIPQLPAAPAVQTVRGDHMSVASQVNYTIQDAYTRTILASTVREYLDFYGAGLKAWEALGIRPVATPAVCAAVPLLPRRGAAPPLTEGPRRNDLLRLNNVHPNNSAITFGTRSRPGTAQRSQARVHANRMTSGTFTDSLRFVTRSGVNARNLDWLHWSGNNTPALVQAERLTAQRRMRDYRAAGNNAALLAPLRTTDAANTTVNELMRICQDVILQLRVGNIRHDLMVLETNDIRIYSPFYFENFNPTPREFAPFSFHLAFAPGTIRSQLVVVNRLRIPP